MAATVYANGQMDAHHQSSAPSHGPEPGSPTLTNPDLILPDYDMPDSPEGSSQSSLRIWEDPNAARMDFQLPPQNFGQRAIPLSTPIIYGNGTMLSDIGEVTEAESNAGVGSRRASSRYSVQMDENETYGSVGVLTAKAQQWKAKIAARERRGSNASISTVTTLEPPAHQAFAEFDDSMSVDDSSFQGDDEESMASSYVEGTDPQARRMERRISNDPDDRYSTAYISDRAERILANAKRRLTSMEGNLTRARTSLAYSPASGETTPSPTIGRPASLRKDQPAPNSPHHSRIRSEDGTRDLTKPSPFPRRAASALGSSGGYRDPTNPSKRNETTPKPNGTTHTISQHPLDTSLETLSEGEDILDDISETDPALNEVRGSGYLSPTLSMYSEKSLNRSASVTQMRDLHDQMQDLKGKISSLKEQARVDSLKRRSLQSLRTPSPFTHARWDQGLMEPREIRVLRSGEATPRASWINDGGYVETQQPQGQTLEKEEVEAGLDTPTHGVEQGIMNGLGKVTPSQQYGDSSPEATTPTQYVGHKEQPIVNNEDIDDLRTENGDESNGEEDALAKRRETFSEAPESQADHSDWTSDSGDSFYEDAPQDQLSHEDREDAFDYEHFFLHSALGSLSRRAEREVASDESDFSDDSVETTRGPVVSAASRRRRQSMETISSVDTFATATEGRASRSSAFQSDRDEEDYYMAQEGISKRDGYSSSRQSNRNRQNSAPYRPASSRERMHRPSTSSFESTGTNRSFPLVGRAKLNGGVLTPGGSPDAALVQVSESLMSDTASVFDGENAQGQSSTAQLQNLAKEDQIAVERLVASLGKCVLALGESSRAGAEARLYRRKIDVARRILEGLDELP